MNQIPPWVFVFGGVVLLVLVLASQSGGGSSGGISNQDMELYKLQLAAQTQRETTQSANRDKSLTTLLTIRQQDAQNALTRYQSELGYKATTEAARIDAERQARADDLERDRLRLESEDKAAERQAQQSNSFLGFLGGLLGLFL